MDNVHSQTMQPPPPDTSDEQIGDLEKLIARTEQANAIVEKELSATRANIVSLQLSLIVPNIL